GFSCSRRARRPLDTAAIVRGPNRRVWWFESRVPSAYHFEGRESGGNGAGAGARVPRGKSLLGAGAPPRPNKGPVNPKETERRGEGGARPQRGGGGLPPADNWARAATEGRVSRSERPARVPPLAPRRSLLTRGTARGGREPSKGVRGFPPPTTRRRPR